MTLDSANKRVRFERAPGTKTSALSAAGGGRPRLGVMIGRRAAGDGESLVIDNVVADSPAAKAGLRAGDVVLSVNGKSAAELDPETMRREFSSGAKVLFGVRRDDQVLEITVSLPDSDSPPKPAESKANGAK